MEVILLERVEKLGGIGDVVKVKNGFARNYLLPNKKALRANESNRKVFEANRAKIEADNAERRTEAEDAKVTKSQIVLDRPIKNIGMHEVKVALHPEGAVTVKVNVARSPEEADLQAQGIDVMAQMFERDTTAFTEEFDPNAEPGATAEAAAEAPTESQAE